MAPISQIFVLVLAVFNLCLGLNCTEDDMLLGQQQLTDILNAAWIRILYNGEYRSIIQNVSNVKIDIADCLPIPDIAPFPNISH